MVKTKVIEKTVFDTDILKKGMNIKVTDTDDSYIAVIHFVSEDMLVLNDKNGRTYHLEPIDIHWVGLEIAEETK